MRNKTGRALVSAAMVGLIAVGLVGCRFRGGASVDDDYIDPMSVMDSGFALAPRGDFGTPIADVQFENVSFAFDSFKIADSERPKIEAVAQYLRSNPRVVVVVDGHCDERGNRDYNLSLGEYRALAVRAYLISLGIPGNRIHTRSFGEEKPLDPRHNEEAWRRNRRAEFSLYRP